MKHGYMKTSSDVYVVISSCSKSQSGSPAHEAEYHKIKDETRIDEIEARAAIVRSHLTMG